MASKEKKPKPRGYWTLKRIRAVAKKYHVRQDFRQHGGGAYAAACRLGILDEICAHMKRRQKPSGYWTPKRILAAAKKYHARTDFKYQHGAAYVAAQKLGILDEVCAHMPPKNRPDGYWTPKRIAAEARKYKTRTEFGKNASHAYQLALKNGSLDRICQHMDCIYQRWPWERLSAKPRSIRSGPTFTSMHHRLIE